jgi:uncharacterized membrane protein YoaK (UPF0700 family)
LHSRPRGCKLADVFTALALLFIAFIAFAMGFEPQFNGPFAIAAVVLLFLGAITDSMWRRFRRRTYSTKRGGWRSTSPSCRSC